MKIKKLVAVLSAAALTVTSLSVAALASGDPAPSLNANASIKAIENVTEAAAPEVTSASSSSSSGSGEPADEGTKTVLSNTETALTNWKNAITIPADKFSSAKAEDKITITVKAVDSGSTDKKIEIQDSSWGHIGGGTYIEYAAPATKEYTITAETLAAIKGGIIIKGVGVTVSEVALITFGSPEETTTPAATEAPSGGNNPGYVVITPNDTTAADTTAAAPEVVTGANGESVEAPKDVVPEGAVLEAKEQTKEEAVKAVEAVKTTDDNKEVVETVKKSVEDGKAAVMDINLVKDGAKVQPNGTIKVTINIPEILKNAAQLFVYRVEDNGTFTDVKATVSGGKLVFSTGHFSTYIITSEALTGDAVVTEAAATTEPAATTAGGSTSTDDKNQATGVVLAVIPAVLAAAGVVASKKRK